MKAANPPLVYKMPWVFRTRASIRVSVEQIMERMTHAPTPMPEDRPMRQNRPVSPDLPILQDRPIPQDRAMVGNQTAQTGPVWTAVFTTVAVLSVLCVVAAFIFRNAIYEFSLNPRQPFQTAPRGTPPDYAAPEAWAAREIDLPPQDGASEADIFFVHGTTYAQPARWNAPLVGAAGAHIDKSVLPAEAKAFQAAGRFFAPRYRQATLYTFRTRSEDSRRARALAYGDVRRAFRHFLHHDNDARPFALAGIGQGGLHVTGLLQDEIAGQDEIAARLVAAYVVAHPVPLDLFEDALSAFRPCAEPTDTGCVLSWTAYPAGVTDRMVTDRSMVWDGRVLTSVATRPILCALPVGAPLPPAGLDPKPVRCRDGIVRVTGLAALHAPRAPYPRRPFHSLTATLFTHEITADLRRRAAQLAGTGTKNSGSGTPPMP